MIKILTILGPTSTGKTDLAINLAKKFNGEIISADSRQLYIGLDIGTGKAPSNGKWKVEDGRWIVKGIPIHMYDVVSPKKQYNVSEYVKDANIILEKINKRGKLPIIVGGSGLYIKSLTEGLSNLQIPLDKKLRRKLEKFSLIDLQQKLKKLSKRRWKNMNYSDQQNPKRLIRAIEIIKNSKLKLPFGDPKSKVQLKIQNFDLLKIGLTAPREILYQKSDERVVKRIEQGMIDEAERLHKAGITLKRFKQLGLEYGILADFLDGKIKTEKDLIKILQFKIHGYIRRQLTWFKKVPNVNWFDINTTNHPAKIEKLVRKWYD